MKTRDPATPPRQADQESRAVIPFPTQPPKLRSYTDLPPQAEGETHLPLVQALGEAEIELSEMIARDQGKCK